MSDSHDNGTPAPLSPPVPPGGGLPPPGWQPGHAPPPPPVAPAPPTSPAWGTAATPTEPAYPAAPPQPGYSAAPPTGYAPMWPQAPRNEGMAIAALVCGIAAIPMSLFCGLGLVFGTLGLIFGLISKGRIDRSPGQLTGRGMALAGAICGGVGIALSVGYWVLIIAVSASGTN